MANVVNSVQQDKKTPLLIRDDGLLVANVPEVARMPQFRPYHGDPNASDADREAYLSGFAGTVKAKFDAEAGAFDIGTATKEALIDFALDEYGARLDGRKSVENLRVEVAALAEKG